MVWTYISQLFNKKWFWIALLFVVAGYFIYHLYSENQQLRLEKAESEQNEAAAKDALTKARDSVTVISAYVENLNSDNKRLKKEVLAWQSNYYFAIDSIRILNQIVHGYMVGDTIGVVTFNGKKNIVTYDGQTQINIRTNDSKLNYLTLSFDEIHAGAELFLDKSDGLWKLRTYTLTDGITVKGVSTIDVETFRQLQKIPNISGEKANIFGVGTLIGKNLFAPGIQVKPSSWEFGAHYIIFDNTKVLDKWQDRIILSAHYFLF